MEGESPGSLPSDATFADRARKMSSVLDAGKLSERQALEFKQISRLKGPLPPRDGIVDGEPFWASESLVAWSERGTRVRGAAVAERGIRTTRKAISAAGKVGGSGRPTTLDEQERTVDALIATETPSRVFDATERQSVLEILVDGGASFRRETVPLLADHSQGKIDDVIGAVSNPRRGSAGWIATLRFASGDPRVEAVWAKVREGILDSVSIGYSILESKLCRPGESITAYGRTYKATDEPTRVVTRYVIHEVSVVAIGADPTARVRGKSAAQRENFKMNANMAIHSKQSRTGWPTRGALVSAALMNAGETDPTRIRAEINGRRLQRLPSGTETEREADDGYRLRSVDLHGLVERAAKLDGVWPEWSDEPFSPGLVRGLYGVRFYGSALESLLSSTFASLLVRGADSVRDITPGWVAEREVLDMREGEALAATESSLTKRPAGAAAKEGHIAASGEKTRVHEYAATWTLDEQAILNGEFANLYGKTPEIIGRAAKKLRPRLALGVLMRNPVMRDGKTLFHVDHGNLLTASALSEETLAGARAAMAKQQESDEPLDLYGRYLIVPEELERSGARLARDVEYGDAESTAGLLVRSDARLANGFTDPLTEQPLEGSATDWFVAAPSSPFGLEFQHPQGFGGDPEITFSMLESPRFGVQWTARQRIGVAALDWRGLVKGSA